MWREMLLARCISSLLLKNIEFNTDIKILLPLISNDRLRLNRIKCFLCYSNELSMFRLYLITWMFFTYITIKSLHYYNNYILYNLKYEYLRSYIKHIILQIIFKYTKLLRNCTKLYLWVSLKYCITNLSYIIYELYLNTNQKSKWASRWNGERRIEVVKEETHRI